MSIRFKTKSGNIRYFNCYWDGVPSFCAASVAYDFYIDSAADDWYEEKPALPEVAAVAQSRLYRYFLASNKALSAEQVEQYEDTPWRPSAGHTLFMGDVKDGPADKYIFSHLPKRPFTIGNIKYYVHMSPYYRNPNSGNMVRHVIIRTEKA